MDNLFQQVFKSAHDPMVIIINDKIVQGNPAFYKISGFKEKEVVEKPFLNFILDKPKVAKIYLKRIMGCETPDAYVTQVAAREDVFTVMICGTKVEINEEMGVFAILKLQ
jgi:PAS domain S-box-containing protein